MHPKSFISLISACAALTAALPIASSVQAADDKTPTYALSSRVAGPDGSWDYVNFDPDHRKLYVSRSDGALALDVDSGALSPHLADGKRTHQVLPLAGGSQLLITNGAANTARLVYAKDGALIADIPTAPMPDGAIFDPASGLVVVMTHSGNISLIDPKAKAVAGTIAVGGALEFAASDGAGKVFVNIEDRNEIAVLDIAGRKVSARYPLKGCEGPGGLAYVKSAGVLISACGNNVAKVIRAATGEEVASLAIGKGPDAVFYDSVRKLAFIPCGRDGVLEVISVRGPGSVTLVQTVPTQLGARTGAVDEKTGRVYLPTAKYVPSTTGGRPTPAPGTFEILVVAPQ